jgi:hypothetical protein
MVHVYIYIYIYIYIYTSPFHARNFVTILSIHENEEYDLEHTQRYFLQCEWKALSLLQNSYYISFHRVGLECSMGMGMAKTTVYSQDEEHVALHLQALIYPMCEG